MFTYLILPYLLPNLVSEYDAADVDVNKEKTKVILKTNNSIIRENVINICNKNGNIEYNFEGNIKYLGVHYGTDTYINSKVNKQIDKLKIKLKNIKLLTSNFVSSNIYRKFYNYNKLIYLIKTTKILDEWISNVMDIYTSIKSELFSMVNYNLLITN